MRRFHGSHYSEGVRLILEGDALWKAQAQEIGGHLRAADHQPTQNMSDSHELSEVARTLSRFEGSIRPPLPHGHGIALRQREEETATRQRRRREAPNVPA